MPAAVRPARPGDVPAILEMIKELAEYEREPEAVVATEDAIRDLLFGGSRTPNGAPAAYCHVIEHEGGVGAMALWFLNCSTWLGSHGVYLEDLFVRPHLRGLGYGRALLSELARECMARGYGRLEWWVLDWNDPAIEFYRSQGAVAMDDWTVYRVTGDALRTLADQD